MPRVVQDPKDIDGPANRQIRRRQAGRGYFTLEITAISAARTSKRSSPSRSMLGCRYYLHFFFDPTATDGFQVRGTGSHEGQNLGKLELLSMDRRDESNVDEFYKPALRDLREMSLDRPLS